MSKNNACQSGGDILYANGHSWSGAGVIVTEDYYSSIGRIPCIVLARDIARNKYNDFGGHYETRYKRLSNAAHQELREESGNLLNIAPHILRQNYSDSSHGEHKYRSYFIKVKGISRKQFKHNRKILQKNKAPSCWLETDNIVHIPIVNIPVLSLVNYGSVHTTDIDGRPVVIHNRARQCLLSGYNKMLYVVNGKSCASAKRDGRIHKSPRFTNGTFSIVKN